MGKTCIHIKDAHVLLASFVGSEKDSIFNGVSNSGETHEVIKLDEMARKHGHQTISITRFGNNTLSKQADIGLRMCEQMKLTCEVQRPVHCMHNF